MLRDTCLPHYMALADQDALEQQLPAGVGLIQCWLCPIGEGGQPAPDLPWPPAPGLSRLTRRVGVSVRAGALGC